jgi:hypothetical protein
MSLTSPGVEVTIIDQSQYLPAPTSSVPLVVIATAQNKANATGTGVAVATTAANAGKLYQVTSQSDLVNLYGVPFFYTTTDGTPIQGYELNEYGLLAAYSVLGQTNRCYVLRADIDLASLVGQTGRPTGAPEDGTWWLDTTTSTWGIYEFNATTGEFTLQNPLVISDSTLISGGLPLNSIGNIGDYAVNAIQQTITTSAYEQYGFFYKTASNTWVPIGSTDWINAWPTIQGTASPSSLTAGSTFTLGIQGAATTTITVPVSPDNTVTGVAGAINALGWTWLNASVSSGRLVINFTEPASTPTSVNEISIATGSGPVLTELGIGIGIYYQPAFTYGTSAQMPLWTTGQSKPRPTGSVWIKVGSSGNGLNPAVSRYNATTAAWAARNTYLANSDAAADAALDPTGGQAIPASTIYGEFNFSLYAAQDPLYMWERAVVGPTIATGSVTNPTFGVSSSGNVYVAVSIPGSSTGSSFYTVTINNGDEAIDFVTAWAAQNIPYTTAAVVGAVGSVSIQLTHTEGGEIYINDYIKPGSANAGESAGILDAAGFIADDTSFVKVGPKVSLFWTGLVPDSHTGAGTGATLAITTYAGLYVLAGTAGSGVTAAGTGYAVGDELTIEGTQFGGASPGNDLVVAVTKVGGSGALQNVTYISGNPLAQYNTQISNWVALDYTANEGAPVVAPANDTNWFYSVVDQVDIMVNTSTGWDGYGNVDYNSSGFPLPSGTNMTDPNGPIISASIPTTQSDGSTALAYGDLWIDTSDLEMYPIISRWQSVSGTDQWVLLDNSNQTGSTGVLFADARWATNGTTNPANDPIPSISSLLVSDYLDLDAPTASTYPVGMLLFNTRRSGYNVKQYRVNYFNSITFPDEALPTETSAWVSVSGLQSNGAPYMGRKAQRNMVVKSLRSVIDTNTDIRDEDNFFNLMATPNYPELQPNMVVLNADRGETGYIIGDTPMRLPADATAIQAWATNAAGATSTGEEGCVTRNTYLGLFYPSGITSDLSGNLVAVPSSHMMLRTFLHNDTVSYPWLAAAGTRRGTIDNATNIGYLDSATGEFITIKTRIGIRDVLYINFINPMVFFTGIGLLNYGNKTSFNSQSSLDRTNVARLVAYIRRQLTIAARPFVFEPNDSITRKQIAAVVQSLLIDLVAKRGIYDYLVICDESNNTPARIDRSELWIDVAIEPVKAAEFIYIPVRILNTGGIAAL